MQVVIADDHALIREGCALVLLQSPSITDVYQATSIDEVEHQLQLHPSLNLVLLDLDIEGMSGVETMQRLKGRHPDTRFAILTGLEQAATAQHFLNSGAAGYIPKSADSQIMVGAVELMLSGGTYIPMFAFEATRSSTQSRFSLSSRQIEVLQAMAEGLSNKHIAKKLHITESTVKKHGSAILTALEVDNRVQAIQKSQRLGLITQNL